MSNKKIFHTPIDYVYLIAPMILGYVTSAVCKMDKKSGEIVKFRPDGYIFGIIWPVLYILLGLSWVLATRSSKNIYKVSCIISYILLTLLLTSWIAVYSCGKNKKGGAFILLATIALCFICFSQGSTLSKMMISPLIAWCIYALLMNTTEIQDS